MIKNLLYPELWQLYYQIEAQVRMQADPYYFNWTQTAIKQCILKLNNRINKNPTSNELRILKEQFQELQILSELNHPWRNLSKLKDCVNPSAPISTDQTQNSAIPKFGWHPPAERLQMLYKRWIQSGKLICDNFDRFVPHFYGTQFSHERLLWTATSKELVSWFSEMINKNVLPYQANYIRIIWLNFANESGQPLNYDSLRASKGKLINSYVEKYIHKTIQELIDDHL